MTAPVFSKRAERALEVLRNGGRFVETFEENGSFGHPCWIVRLYLGDAYVRGFGVETFKELRPRLRLEVRDDGALPSGSWVLDTEAGR